MSDRSIKEQNSKKYFKETNFSLPSCSFLFLLALCFFFLLHLLLLVLFCFLLLLASFLLLLASYFFLLLFLASSSFFCLPLHIVGDRGDADAAAIINIFSFSGRVFTFCPERERRFDGLCPDEEVRCGVCCCGWCGVGKRNSSPSRIRS